MNRTTLPTGKATPVVPTRPAMLQPPQRTTQPTRVLNTRHAPQQLAFSFYR
jgi:hypothetical protein